MRTASMRRRRRQGGRLSAVLGALVIVLAGCGSGSDTTAGADAPAKDRVALAGPQRTVKVGTLRQPHLSHVLFYDRFLPANVKVQVVPFANSTEIKNAVVSGDLSFGVSGITSALQAASLGEPIVVVASAADGGSGIVARKEAGISKISDLKGKKIGYVPASTQDILLRLTLEANGLKPATDVQLVKVQYSDMAAALARGDIDAYSGAETGVSDALTKGDGVLVAYPYDTPMGKINISLSTSQSLIDKDPELVQAMVSVHAKATDHMKAHPTEWSAAVESKYGVPEKSLGMAIKNIELRWRLDDAYLKEVRVLGAEQVKLQQISKQPDYTKFINTTFVGKVG